MVASKVISVEDLRAAMAGVVTLFTTHCEHGSQTQDLHNQSVAACGQFVSPTVEQITQRGMHGTSAAISVLAQSEARRDSAVFSRSTAVLERLVRYANDRTSGESSASHPASNDAIQRDQLNIIKQSELLFALSRVPENVPNVKAMRSRITRDLQAALISTSNGSVHSGWSYFMNEECPQPQVLPTAHAVLALASVNHDVSGSLAFLMKALEEDNGEEEADISIRIFALYVLTFRHRSDHARQESDDQLRVIFDRLWERTVRLLAFDNIEQNIEYWRGAETLYVRVPWQLYLLALASRLRFYKRFATSAAQSRLCEVIMALKENRFRYPSSGRHTSSRTTSIAFETCGHILSETRRHEWLIAFLVVIDRIRTSRWVRRLGGTVAFGVMVYAIRRWYIKGGDLADIAPEFVEGCIIALLLWSRKEPR